MKVRTDRATLANTLGWVARAISKQPVAPALAGVRVTATDEGQLALRAFDYEIGHAATIEAEVASAGECLVPGTFLLYAVTGGRGKDVELAFDAGALTITSGRSTYRVRSLALEDYPALPERPDPVGTADVGALTWAVESVAPSVDDASFVDGIRGLRLEVADGRLHFIGTDRFRLHTASIAWDGESFEATVPVRTLAASLKGLRGAVQVGYRDGLLGLADDERTVTTRCFDASQYVAWRGLVARSTDKQPHTFTTDAGDLLEAAKHVAAVTEGDAALILEYADGELAVRTGESEIGDGVEILAAEGSGPPLVAAVTPRYLSDLLTACTGGPIEVRYSTGAAPLLITDPDAPALSLLLMTRKLVRS